MHDIVLIESFKVDDKKNIVITAIVEDMVYIPGSQTLIDPPEYAPSRCTITIPNDHLPDNTNLDDVSEEALEELINRNVNIDNYDWVISDKEENRYSDLYL